MVQWYHARSHAGNYKAGRRTEEEIAWIVLHGTEAWGDTARENADVLARAVQGRSFHYLVDETEVWQTVRVRDVAWHCGTRGAYYHPRCRNRNSIGIGVCILNDQGQIREACLKNALRLVQCLRMKYALPPGRVLRHFDVTHTACPEPFVRDAALWRAFQNAAARTEGPA